MDVAERDRSEPVSIRHAGEEPDLPLARRDLRPGSLETRKPQPDEFLRHASTTAMQDADHDLLSNKAALRERDRALLDSRFQWDRVVGHIDPEDGIAGTNAGR